MHGAHCTLQASRGPLTKDTKQETIILNRSGRSTYPEENFVQTSGATLNPGTFDSDSGESKCSGRRPAM